MPEEIKQGEIKQEVAVEQPATPPTLEQLQAELAKRDAKIEELNKGLKTAGQTIKERTNALNDLGALRSQVTMLTDYVKEIGNTKLETDAAGQVKLVMPKQDITGKMDAVAKQAKVVADINARKERVEALGLDPESEEYLEIKDFTTRGQFGIADKKIAKLEAAKKQPEGQKMETEDQRIDRLATEKAQKIANEQLRAAGLLKPEGGSPSAVSSSFKTKEQAYNDGKISYSEYMKARKEAGIN